MLIELGIENIVAVECQKCTHIAIGLEDETIRIWWPIFTSFGPHNEPYGFYDRPSNAHRQSIPKNNWI